MTDGSWGHPLSTSEIARLRGAPGVRTSERDGLLELQRASDGFLGRLEPVGPESIVEPVRRQARLGLLEVSGAIDPHDLAELGWTQLGNRTYLASGAIYEVDFWSVFEVKIGGWTLFGLANPQAAEALRPMFGSLGEIRSLHAGVRHLGTWAILAGDDCDHFDIVICRV